MNILITGAGSYVGTQVENWLKKDGQFRVDAVDTFGDNWTLTYSFIANLKLFCKFNLCPTFRFS